MRANKVFFDLYSTSGGKMPHEEYRRWYDKHDLVYIVLVDMGIYTTIKRKEMFDRGLHYGCFIENCPQTTPDEVVHSALNFANKVGAKYVDIETFIELEKRGEEARVRQAFACAEKMIRED